MVPLKLVKPISYRNCFLSISNSYINRTIKKISNNKLTSNVASFRSNLIFRLSSYTGITTPLSYAWGSKATPSLLCQRSWHYLKTPRAQIRYVEALIPLFYARKTTLGKRMTHFRSRIDSFCASIPAKLEFLCQRNHAPLAPLYPSFCWDIEAQTSSPRKTLFFISGGSKAARDSCRYASRAGIYKEKRIKRGISTQRSWIKPAFYRANVSFSSANFVKKSYYSPEGHSYAGMPALFIPHTSLREYTGTLAYKNIISSATLSLVRSMKKKLKNQIIPSFARSIYLSYAASLRRYSNKYHKSNLNKQKNFRVATTNSVATRRKNSNFFIVCRQSRIETNRSFYGSFYLGPFDPGQSLTIANALRRTLLSELTGIAITGVEIEGALHEYSNLVGVRDSVLDILLNLKEIVIKKINVNSHFSDFHSSFSNDKKEKVTLRILKTQVGYLRARGPGIIKAADLKLPPFLQCVDPEQYIATLSEDGYLNMKFFINEGKNYHLNTPSNNLDLTQITKRRFLIKKLLKTTKDDIEEQKNLSSFSMNPSLAGASYGSTEDLQKKEERNALLISPDLNLAQKKYKTIFPSSNILQIDPLFMPVTKVNYIIESSEQFNDILGDPNHASVQIPQNQIKKLNLGNLNSLANGKKPSLGTILNNSKDIEKRVANSQKQSVTSFNRNKTSFTIKTTKTALTKIDFKHNVILEIWTNGSINPKKALYDGIKNLLHVFGNLNKVKFLGSFYKSEKTYKKFLNFSILKKNNLSPSPVKKPSTAGVGPLAQPTSALRTKQNFVEAQEDQQDLGRSIYSLDKGNPIVPLIQTPSTPLKHSKPSKQNSKYKVTKAFSYNKYLHSNSYKEYLQVPLHPGRVNEEKLQSKTKLNREMLRENKKIKFTPAIKTASMPIRLFSSGFPMVKGYKKREEIEFIENWANPIYQRRSMQSGGFNNLKEEAKENKNIEKNLLIKERITETDQQDKDLNNPMPVMPTDLASGACKKKEVGLEQNNNVVLESFPYENSVGHLKPITPPPGLPQAEAHKSPVFESLEIQTSSVRDGDTKKAEEDRESQIKSKIHLLDHAKESIYPSNVNFDLKTLNFSLRTYNCLKKANILFLDELLKYSKSELYYLKKFGEHLGPLQKQKCLQEVEQKLKMKGLSLRKKN